MEAERTAWVAGFVGMLAAVGSTVGKGGGGVDPALQATINPATTAKKLANTGGGSRSSAVGIVTSVGSYFSGEDTGRRPIANPAFLVINNLHGTADFSEGFGLG